MRIAGLPRAESSEIVPAPLRATTRSASANRSGQLGADELGDVVARRELRGERGGRLAHPVDLGGAALVHDVGLLEQPGQRLDDQIIDLPGAERAAGDVHRGQRAVEAVEAQRGHGPVRVPAEQLGADRVADEFGAAAGASRAAGRGWIRRRPRWPWPAARGSGWPGRAARSARGSPAAGAAARRRRSPAPRRTRRSRRPRRAAAAARSRRPAPRPTAPGPGP